MIKKNSLPSQDYLSECFDYCADSGVLLWTSRPREHFKTTAGWNIFNSKNAWKEVKAIQNSNGKKYITVHISGKSYLAHRIIWKLLHGYDPDEIDHINGNGLDNKLSNIREVDRKENCKNQKRKTTNKSGVCGVIYREDQKKWTASIRVDDKQKHIGSYIDFNEAVLARLNAEKIYGYHERHGEYRAC
jgi:hypothetical protein